MYRAFREGIKILRFTTTLTRARVPPTAAVDARGRLPVITHRVNDLPAGLPPQMNIQNPPGPLKRHNLRSGDAANATSCVWGATRAHVLVACDLI